MTRKVARRLLVLAFLGAAAPAMPGEPASPERGALLYGRCQGCHALAYDRTGPRHCGLYGRRAGSVAGFAYSPAMAASAIVWDENTLDRFLANPTRMVPGTAMGYAGIADPKERADLIAWLRQASSSPSQCPP